MTDIKAILDEILLEDILEREGWDYRIGHGSSGEQLQIHECPFCHGANWKVYANRDTGLGNCFHGSCGETFNIFSFTAALTGGTNAATYRYIEQIAREQGWRPKRRKETEVEVEENREWRLPESYELPTTDGKNLRYLEKRRVDGATAAYFKLRYCPDGWYNYTKPDGSQGGMYFGERVLIPIYDIDGTMVTFQGRDLTGESDRKYLFPPGLPGTGRFLLNGHNAVGKQRVILCEGAFDVIRTWVNTRDSEWSDAGVIGSFGVHLSHGQDGNDQKSKFLDLKKQGLREVIVFWDGEDMAFKKALGTAKRIKSMGFRVRIARPPGVKDPGELSVQETLAALDAAQRVDQMSLMRMRLG